MKNIILIIFCCMLTAPACGYANNVVISVLNPSGVRMDGSFVDETLKEAMLAQAITKPSKANDFPRTTPETVQVTGDGLKEINELFYDRGWSDGLPIIPPTPERVADMLRGSDISADFSLGTLAPLNGEATIEKIAINAVMAGCSPKHMSILIAAVEAVMTEDFDLRGWSTTTNPDAGLLIISGPIVKDLDINAGTNTFGRGWRSNATLSRAFHLILQNIGGSWPGVTDMSTMGQPGEYVMLFAENAEANPWSPFHTSFGLSAYANVVTVAAVEGYSGILGIGQSREGYLKLIANWLKGHDRPYRNTVILVIAQDTANMLAQEGWTREKIVDFISSEAKVPLGEIKEQFIDTGMAKGKGIPAWVFNETDMSILVQKPFIDNFIIIVAGGPGEKSMILPCWAAGQTVSNEIRLPANWKELVQE